MISTIYGHHRCTSTFINLHKYGAIDRYIQWHLGPHGAFIPIYNYQSTLADLKCVCRHSCVLLYTMCRYLLVDGFWFCGARNLQFVSHNLFPRADFLERLFRNRSYYAVPVRICSRFEALEPLN